MKAKEQAGIKGIRDRKDESSTPPLNNLGHRRNRRCSRMSAVLQQVRQNGGECSDAPADGPGADGAGCLVGPGRAGGSVGGPALLGLLLGRGWRGGGRLGAEELEGEEHLVDGVDGEGPDDAERVVDGDVDDSGGNVELVLRVGGDVESVGPVAPGRLRADGVAGGLERLERVELREDVALHQ
jgi:hypothetical protein